LEGIAENIMNGKDVGHPSISTAPSRPQQVLTIGLVRDIVSESFVKVGKLLEIVDHYLYAAAQAFMSHSKSSIEKAFALHSTAGSA